MSLSFLFNLHSISYVWMHYSRPRNKYNLHTDDIYTHFYVHNKRTILKPYREKIHFERKPRLYRTNKPNLYMEKKKVYCENSNKNFRCLSPQPSLWKYYALCSPFLSWTCSSNISKTSLKNGVGFCIWFYVQTFISEQGWLKFQQPPFVTTIQLNKWHCPDNNRFIQDFYIESIEVFIWCDDRIQWIFFHILFGLYFEKKVNSARNWKFFIS